MPKSIPPRTRLGCGFLCVAALLTCVLLSINGLIVLNLYNSLDPTFPEEWRRDPPRMLRAVIFTAPLFLLVIEWWVCDVTIDWLRPLRK